MTHAPWGEGSEGVMTDFALSGRRNVVSRLAERIRPVVAGCTASRYGRSCSGVIECCCRPSDCGVMAGIALRCSSNVRRRLDLGILRDIGTTVAGRALPG